MTVVGWTGRRNREGRTYVYLTGLGGRTMSCRLAPGDECPDSGPCYNWGCQTPSAYRLARAILWTVTKDLAVVKACQEAFVRDVIANLPVMDFELSAAQVGNWMVAVVSVIWFPDSSSARPRRGGK